MNERIVNVLFLKPDKSTVWLTVRWGKAHLDHYRNMGWVILMTD
jgi:hypothetical protein